MLSGTKQRKLEKGTKLLHKETKWPQRLSMTTQTRCTTTINISVTTQRDNMTTQGHYKSAKRCLASSASQLSAFTCSFTFTWMFTYHTVTELATQ